MGRKPLIRTEIYPYHVTSRSNNKEWFDLPMSIVWELCLKSLKVAYVKEQADVISFVLMSNHYHLLIRTPSRNLDKFMYEFNKNLSLLLREKTQRVNRMFGGRYKWCLVRSHRYFANCYRYVYQNPLRASLVEKCEDYPFSTLFYKARGLSFIIPLYDKFGFTNYYKLSWINNHICDKELRAIRSGLYRSLIISLKDPVSRTLI